MRLFMFQGSTHSGHPSRWIAVVILIYLIYMFHGVIKAYLLEMLAEHLVNLCFYEFLKVV